MIRMTGLVDLRPVAPVVTEEEKAGTSQSRPDDVPQKEKISIEKLTAASKKSGKLGKRARLALTLRKIKEIYNMSEEDSSKMDALEDELDPIGQEDADVDNDGDVDSSDKYLKHRRDVVGSKVGKESVNEEAEDFPSEVDDHEGSMAKADLLAIHKKSAEIYNMLADGEELEGWVQSKITRAADYINAIHNNLSYEKSKPATVGNGEGSPADATKGPEVARMAESAPAGMKKRKNIDNPFALAQYMKKQGRTPSK